MPPARNGSRVGDDLRHADLVLGLVGGVGEDGFAREAVAGSVLAHHVVDRGGVGSGLDAADIERGERFDMAEDGFELLLENGALLLAEFESCESGDVADVDGVMGHGGRIGEESPGGGKGGMWKRGEELEWRTAGIAAIGWGHVG